MTNEMTVAKAIEKATNNGWDMHGIFPGKYKSIHVSNDVISGLPTVSVRTEWNGRIWGMGAVPLFAVIYDQDFCKALWGEEEYEDDEATDPQGRYRDWEVRLMQMVISSNPIEYLEKNI